METLLLLATLLFAQGAIEASVPVTLQGRLTVDDGSALPLVETFRGPNVVFGLEATLPDGAGRIAEATTRADGSFVITVTTAAGTGQFGIVPTRIPLGYYVKAIKYGAADLLQSPLAITRAPNPNSIEVVLTKTYPAGTPGGVKVSGRVTKLENAAAGTPLTISFQAMPAVANGRVPTLHLGLTPVNADGTFEIRGVPAGRYLIRTQPGLRSPTDLAVGDRDVSGLEIELSTPSTLSILITSNPMTPFATALRGSPFTVAQPSTPPVPPAGVGIVSAFQSQTRPRRIYTEGAISFFRIEQAGTIVEEKRIEGNPLTFSLGPGNYELRSYFRGCDGNCGRLGPPEILCSTPIIVAAGQVLYAERLTQEATCTIRVSSPIR